MRRISSALAVCAALAIAATAAPAVIAAPADQASSRTIVETAVAAGQFKTLTSLVTRAGLADTLSGRGPYTVFAPTDAAFAKVPRATLARLARNRSALRSVLLHHVAAGRLNARRVVARRSIRTLDGQRVRVRVRRGKAFVGGARVLTPDVRANNGVIHVINRVLIPR